ncbi:hypothetical protein AB0D13_40655 [Streptomyces sp. NPDC048430]|uniref:DUF3846 domain-containing protein n=1 Tax=Streptomyces sp. NPDC048430 TaxID=3155388 RepID=UPI0034492BB6
MIATAMATRTFALWVSPTGSFRLLEWGVAETPHAALCSDTPQATRLTPDLTLWTDRDAIALRRPRNAPASELLRAYQPHPGLHFGDVLFTGAAALDAGAPQGLTEDQALTLLDLYLLRSIPHVPASRLP